MNAIFEIATKVSTPLALGGFCLAVLFFLIRQIIRREVFPRLTRMAGADIFKLIIERLFVLALVAMVLGFAGYALRFVSTFGAEDPSQGANMASSKPLVRVLDSTVRRRAVSQIVGTLQPFEQQGRIVLEPTLIAKDANLADQLTDATLLVVHLHAFREVSESDKVAEDTLATLLVYLRKQNREMNFLVYSRSFAYDSDVGKRWLTAIEREHPTLQGSISVMPFREESVLPVDVADELRDHVRAVFSH